MVFHARCAHGKFGRRKSIAGSIAQAMLAEGPAAVLLAPPAERR
jgi:hypothetical protein